MSFSDIAKYLLIFGVYYFTAIFGLKLNAVSGFAALIWPPSGVALAALLLNGIRFWPAVTLAAFLANYVLGANAFTASGIAIGNTLEPIVATFLLQKVYTFDPTLSRRRDVIYLMILGAGFSTVFSASIGVVSLWLGGALASHALGPTWRAWWVGDAMSVLILTPLILLWANVKPVRFRRQSMFEGLLLLVSLFAVGQIVFGNWANALGIPNQTLSFWLFPFVIIAAFRFGQIGSATTTFLIFLMASWGINHDFGAYETSFHSNLFLLHSFLSIMIASGMLLAASLAEKKLAVETASEEQAQKTAFLASSLDSVVSMDHEGKVIEFNPAAEKIFGYKRSEAMGKDLAELIIPPRMRDKHRRGLRRYMNGGSSKVMNQRIEIQAMRSDGSELPVELTVIQIPTSGNPKFTGYIRDISDRKMWEKSMMQSRDQLDIILKGITDGITVIDHQAKFVYANETGAKIFGFSSLEEFLQKPPLEVFKSFDVFTDEGDLVNFDQLYSNLPESVFRFRNRKTGEVKWLMIKSAPVFDDTRQARLFVSIFKDFTEHKRTEEEFKFLDETSRVLSYTLDYERTFQNLAALMVPKLADWCVIDILEQESGTPRRIAIANHDPKKVAWALEFQKKYPPDWNAPLGSDRVLRTGRSEWYPELPSDFLKKISTTDEHLILLNEVGIKSLVSVPLNSRGKTFGVMTLVISESSTRRYTSHDLFLAEELARRAGMAIDNALLYKQAQKAIQVRDEFLSIASHELKTPITSLSLQIEMARNRPPPPEKLAKVFDISGKQVARLSGLVEDLLDTSRIQLGSFSFSFEYINLSNIVADMVGRFSEEFKKAKCTVQASIEENVFGYFDQARIEQVIDNFLSNAIKYAPQKPVQVTLSTQSGSAKLVVRDFGPGIPSAQHSRIFKRFERLTPSMSTSGLGLGLFIVHEIVKGHQGSVRVESGTGEGCQFIVELPQAPKISTAIESS